MTGTIGLTEKQDKRLKELLDRVKPLTDNMKGEFQYLIEKRGDKELSKTTKGALIELWIEEKYGRSKEIFSRYLDKGIAVEDDSITLLSSLDVAFYQKNEERYENEWLTGTPDIVSPLIDIKSSWDIFTFFKAKHEPINKDYEYQLQGYMDLTGADQARLVYCLVNTPEHIVDKENNYLPYKTGLDPNNTFELQMAVEDLSVYDDIPEAERTFEFLVKRDDNLINQIHERVELCRDWVQTNLK